MSAKITEQLTYAVRIRRTLHSMPELSDMEYKTSDFLFSELQELGYTPVRIHTGLFIDVPGTKRGKRIALRCDIDALPLAEMTGLPFASANGCMHACGHDAHSAMCMTVAKLLVENAPENDVRIIFQFGEEGSGGAARMIESGVIDGVDMIFALHLSPDVPKGVFALKSGAMFAGVVEFNVTFSGVSSHIANREEGVNALNAAVRFINGMDGIMNGYENARYQTGKIVSGCARNIIPDKADLECTLRFFDRKTAGEIMSSAEKLITEAARETGAEGVLNVLAEYPPLINDGKAVEIFRKMNGAADTTARYTGEDFAMYLEKTSGCMAWLGVRDSAHNYPLHSDKFDFDESVMLTGIEALVKLANIEDSI